MFGAMQCVPSAHGLPALSDLILQPVHTPPPAGSAQVCEPPGLSTGASLQRSLTILSPELSPRQWHHTRM